MFKVYIVFRFRKGNNHFINRLHKLKYLQIKWYRINDWLQNFTVEGKKMSWVVDVMSVANCWSWYRIFTYSKKIERKTSGRIYINVSSLWFLPRNEVWWFVRTELGKINNPYYDLAPYNKHIILQLKYLTE